jgi:predicted dehydrogenase
MPATADVRVGVVGLGYWGPNLARNFNAIDGCELAWCCDADDVARRRWSTAFPDSKMTGDLDEVLADEGVDAIAVTTPVPTHAELAERVLAAGKHCFVEKPLTQDVESAERLVELADERDLILMAGHLLEYHPGIERLKQLVTGGELGEVHYVYSQRLNLGKLRSDENALWSLGAHDISVVLSLAEETPVEVWAQGEGFVREGVEDVVFAFLRYPSGIVAHLHLSWLDPHKMRKITVVGSKRMATLDDMALERKLTVFDKGFDRDFQSYGEYITRAGDVWSPAIPNAEPLRIECTHFLDCVRSGTTPRSDGESGLRVVRVLEALQKSLDSGGAVVEIASATSGAVR